MRRTSRGLLVSLASTLVLAAGSSEALGASEPYQRPGRSELVSVTPEGTSMRYSGLSLGCGGTYWGGQADVSASGRYVIFGAAARDVVSTPSPPIRCDIFWRDRAAGKTRQVNVSSDGAQPIEAPGGRAHVSGPSLSADGRWVAFHSLGVNLVPGDTNQAFDIFLRDTRRGKTARVSVSTGGGQSNGPSTMPSVSGDGRFVAFVSDATNLVAGDTNGAADVFVHDTKTLRTRRVSVSSTGEQGAGSVYGGGVSISANGRYVAFASTADNLVPGDTLNAVTNSEALDVFRHDMRTRKTIRVSVASDGRQASFAAFPSCTIGAPGSVTLPSPIGPIIGSNLRQNVCHSRLSLMGGHAISDDGRFITFMSGATNLVPNDSNFGGFAAGGSDTDVFVHDGVSHRTERVSVNTYGQEIPEGGQWGRISGDGQHVALDGTYQGGGACSSGIGPIPLSSLPCSSLGAFTYDRLSGVREKLAVSSKGKEPQGGNCTNPADGGGFSSAMSFGISRDGRYAAFMSNGKDITSNDNNDRCDYFVRDRGRVLGVGGFGGDGSGGPSSGDDTCVEGVCLPPLFTVDSVGEVPVADADLIAARVVPRPGLGDLFVRLDLARMPQVAGVPAGGPLCGLTFTAGGDRYEVRVQRVPGADFDPKGAASFGLFRQDPATGLFTKVASLNGGYGTTGDSVVFAIPVKELAGGQLADVRAFTGIGSYLTGSAKVLDMVRLGR